MPGARHHVAKEAVSGQLQVDPVSYVGLLAYPATAELANTAVLDGADVESDVSVVEVLNRPSVLPGAATVAYSCSADAAAVGAAVS